MKALHMAHDDEVKGQILNDDILKRLGTILLHKLGERRKNDIIQRLRQLARLKIEMKETAIINIIKGSRFDDVCAAVRRLANAYVDADKVVTFKAPSLALHLGNHLRRVANVVAGFSLKQDDTETRKSK